MDVPRIPLLAAAALIAATAFAPLASAAVTRGEAEAVLHAYPTGGRAILDQAGGSVGAPADFSGSHGAIRPISGTPFDGAHFCADDWHAVVIAFIDGNGIGLPQDPVTAIRARLDSAVASFTLNGLPLETTRGATTPFHGADELGGTDLFAFQQGTVMKLPVGTYTLAVHETSPIYGDIDDGITFFVDTASCS